MANRTLSESLVDLGGVASSGLKSLGNEVVDLSQGVSDFAGETLTGIGNTFETIGNGIGNIADEALGLGAQIYESASGGVSDTWQSIGKTGAQFGLFDAKPVMAQTEAQDLQGGGDAQMTQVGTEYSLNAAGWTTLGSLVSGMFNMYGSYQKTRMAQETYEAKARIAEMNARMQHIKAQMTLHNTNRQIAGITAKYGAVKSKQRVAAAANGIAIGYGSHRDIQATTELYKQIDVHTAYANGIYAALGFRNKAAAYMASASAYRASKPSTAMSVTASFVDMVGNVADTYNEQMNNPLKGGKSSNPLKGGKSSNPLKGGK